MPNYPYHEPKNCWLSCLVIPQPCEILPRGPASPFELTYDPALGVLAVTMAQDVSSLQLLSSVIPAFLKLSRDLNPIVAVQASTTIGMKATFPVKLHFELFILSQTLSSLEKSIQVPEDSLETILTMLDGLCVIDARVCADVFITPSPLHSTTIVIDLNIDCLLPVE